MNCKLNGVLANLPQVDKIYIQPASSDNGVSLGAAMLSARNDKGKFTKMVYCYYGNNFSDSSIKSSLKEAKIKFKKI